MLWKILLLHSATHFGNMYDHFSACHFRYLIFLHDWFNCLLVIMVPTESQHHINVAPNSLQFTSRYDHRKSVRQRNGPIAVNICALNCMRLWGAKQSRVGSALKPSLITDSISGQEYVRSLSNIFGSYIDHMHGKDKILINSYSLCYEFRQIM